MALTIDSFERPADLSNLEDPKVAFARSFLLMRLIVGGLGALLPTSLILLDWVGFKDCLGRLRGSLSAYYYSPARDLFVGTLCVLGFFLVTYLSQRKTTWDYVLSTIAGVGAVGVAFFPTQRPGLEGEKRRCASANPILSDLTGFQQVFGEKFLAWAHFIFAALFIGSLAALCLFVFARRDKKFGIPKPTTFRRFFGARFHQACGFAIVGGILWILLGQWLDLVILGVQPLYVGEVVAVYAFSASWLAKGWDLLRAD